LTISVAGQALISPQNRRAIFGDFAVPLAQQLIDAG